MDQSSLVSRWIDRSRKQLRLQGPLARDPTAQVLHSLLLALACWRFLCFPLILPFALKTGGAAALFGGFLLIDLVALGQLRRGSFASASLVYLCGNWLAYTVLIFLTTGVAGRSTVFYLVLPISAAWLLGARPALLSAAVCLLSMLIFGVAQELGVQFSGYFSSAAPVPRWSETIVAMITTIVPVARILQILQEALAGSRETEQVLQEHRAGLEKLVQQRTAELEQARDEAQAASRAKTVFLATLGHQLRSPLNAILLLSDPASADPISRRNIVRTGR
jgi:signal transduction histidine kinase